MANETDRKTTVGVLDARKKTEEVRAKLNAMEPENDVLVTSLRRARGLALALALQLENLDHGIASVKGGREAHQMDLDEVLRPARASFRPSELKAWTKTVDALGTAAAEVQADPKQAAIEDSDVDDAAGEDEAGDDDDEPAPTESDPEDRGGGDDIDAELEAAARDLEQLAGDVGDDVPSTEDLGVENIARLLKHAGRPIADVVIDRWSEVERDAAATWALFKIRGEKSDAPPVLSRQYLEDLDLEEDFDLSELLGWVGVESPKHLVSSCDEEDLGKVVGWAVALHRTQRGEADVAVPKPPEFLVPKPELLLAVWEILEEPGGPLPRHVIASYLRDTQKPLDAAPVKFAIDALVAAGAVREVLGGVEPGDLPAIDFRDESLREHAIAAMRGRPAPAAATA